jgi:transposase
VNPQQRKIAMAKSGKSKSRGGRKQHHPAKLKPQDWTLGLSVVHPKAAGIDIGNEEHYVAVPPSLDAEPLRVFGCFTVDLIALADWLKQCRIETVAMQSTGVYWMALYDILEERGIRVFLVNARDTKNMPGRKSDVQECQWLLKLHVYGLLKNSFRPEEEIRVMRTIWRQRQQQIADAARCIQRMQKALTQMNLQLANVISDISGWTGQSIIRAILSGQRDPQQLAQFRDPRVKATEAVIAKSLEGTWREDLLFVLKQEFESYQSFQKKIEECDEKLYEHLQRMEQKADPKTLPECKRNKRPHGNVPQKFDLREELYRILGVDLTTIDGINGLTVQTLIAEVGHDMSRWPTEGSFASWLNLAPNNKISGGKVIGRDKRKVVNRAGQALRQAASTLLRSQTYLGAQYRRLRAKLGAPKAAKAMAAKLARIFYRGLKHGQVYVDKGSEFYEQKYREQQIKILTKKAAELGLQVIHSA